VTLFDNAADAKLGDEENGGNCGGAERDGWAAETICGAMKREGCGARPTIVCFVLSIVLLWFNHA
jgi:hypothetical protein